MSEVDPAEFPILVHALLVCRAVEQDEQGHLSIREVLEIIAVDEMPADVGPLTFVAFVRGLPPGEQTCSFVLYPAGNHEQEVARADLKAEVTELHTSRQMVLRVEMPSLPLQAGGMFDVVFKVNDRPLAMNRFAVGARHGSPDTETSS